MPTTRVGTGPRVVRRPAAAATALALLVVAGCSAGRAPDTRPPAATSSSAPGPGAGSATATQTPAPPPARPAPVRVAVAGDIHFEGVLADRLRDPATALGPVSSPMVAALADADVAIVNLESSIGTAGRPEPGKRFTFSAGTEALTALAAAGIDVASMANNHALDFGRARLPSTLRAVRAAATSDPPLAVVGLGRDRGAAYRPAIIDIGGTVVATIGATVADQDPTADRTGQWAATDDVGGTADALDPRPLLDAVRGADESADVVVTYLHWGVQGESCASADQRTLARAVVRAGADVVVGSHAHQLQGDGRLGRGYVAYGLGNFAWYSPGTEATSRTGVLTLTVRPAADRSGRARVTRTSWRYGVIGADGLPRPTGEADTAELRTRRDSLRACAGLSR